MYSFKTKYHTADWLFHFFKNINSILEPAPKPEDSKPKPNEAQTGGREIIKPNDEKQYKTL